MAAHSISTLTRRTALGIASLGLLVAAVHATEAGNALRTDRMSIETMKSVYLECERSASGGRQGTGEAMYCSIVYEDLKQQAFGGEFQRIRTWLASQSAPAG